MDTLLWSEILKFDLDNPKNQYGFSTRLAFENNWTAYFTKTAILEYKKFMYLAATSSEMVSPSEIVDIVWHQHLIFTTSYSDLCVVLKKRIEHIPSTHNRAETEKFQRAKEITKQLYGQNFGDQPKEIWEYTNQFEALHLDKSKVETGNIKKIFIVSLIVLIIPVYYLLKPILIQIKNPDFLIYYFLLFTVVLVLAAQFVKTAFKVLYRKIKSNLVLANLSPLELVFLKKNKLEYVVQGVINNLIISKKIKILNNRLELIDGTLTDNQYENCVIEIMKDYDPLTYPQLYKTAELKPIFAQIEKGVSKIRETITASKQFLFVVKIIMLILAFLLSIGFSRFISGIVRDKPVTYLFFALIILIAVSNYYLNKMTDYLFSHTIPSFFKEEKQTEEIKKDWQWDYFFYGEIILVSSFIPLTEYAKTNYFQSSGGGSGSNCSSSSSSCSSSCGSSCGGCGGGD
ncbi:hypothetical protein [Flavobacterium sp. FlaQc-48]|uniref:hypothetical protein n=1 Tax=Flavobacterium sp. FlaQc-48 TaxID=3374181 RepID=UPI003756CC17